MTQDTILLIKQAFTWDATVEEACTHAGVSRNTFYVWLKKHPEFQDVIDTLRQTPTLKARQTVVKSLEDPNHAFRYLERKRRREFGANVDLTTDGKALPTPIIPLDVSGNNSDQKDSGTVKED
jgi:transposase-like protein